MFQPQQQQQQQEVQLATWIRDTYSPDAQARQSAEGRITAARDGNPGLYFELLLGIIENRSGFYGADQRQSAALLLRQGFDSRDRLSRGGENIKERVIEQALLEATQPVYAQLSEAVARLVRALYPAKWPTVLNTLCDVLQSTAAAAAQQLHALDLLNRAVKAVGSMRLGTGAKHFAASGTAARTLTLAHSIFTHSLTVPGVGSDNGGSACTAAVLALRLARNTALYGVGNYGTSAEFGGFFKDACTLVAALAQGNAIGGNGGSQSAGPVEFSGKLVQSVLKTLRKAMKRRPDAFVPYLSATLELVAGVIRSEAPCCRTERTVIFAYRVIAQTLVRSAEKGYKLELHKGTTAQPPAWLVAGSQAIKAFFTGERLREIITVSITRHMVLTDAELMQSVQDPEAFMELEEAGSYKTSRAACVQHTLSVILEAFPGAFAAPLTEFLSDALRVSPNSLQAVLAKDAVYAAVGVAAYELADAIPFDQVIPRWIEEIAYVDPAYASVPRRRLAWLLGNVISANMQAPPLVLAYKFLVPLLSDPDLSVAFTAAASIHALVDNLFDINEFNPFAEACIKGLFTLLLNRAEQVESKIRILNTICVIAQQSCAGVVASAGIIAEGLGETWKRSEGSEDESVKLNIISCFTYLAMAISYGDQASLSVATQIAPYVTGLIQTVHSSPNVFIFLGDTLELWCTFLYHTPAFTEDVLRLCVSGKLDAIIEIATDEEKLTYVSRILDAYFTMAGPAFASSPAADALVAAITKVYPSLSPRGIAYLLRPLVTMFLVTERLTTAGQALIEKLFADLDTFATAETPDALVAALTILARAVINRNTELLPKLCTNSVLLAGFVAVTINALDSVPSIPTKKLIALALHAVIIKAEECGLPGSNVITQDARPHIEGVIAEINAIGGINLLTDSISDNTYLVEGSAMHTAIQNLKRNDPVFITELK